MPPLWRSLGDQRAQGVYHRCAGRESRNHHGEVEDGACMFLVDLPDPAIRIDRVLDTIDSSMPGGHSVVTIDNLRVPADQMMGAAGEGFKYAQVRLSPARLSHCMRWLGSAKIGRASCRERVCQYV